jgi:hypothetical protein
MAALRACGGYSHIADLAASPILLGLEAQLQVGTAQRNSAAPDDDLIPRVPIRSLVDQASKERSSPQCLGINRAYNPLLKGLALVYCGITGACASVGMSSLTSLLKFLEALLL